MLWWLQNLKNIYYMKNVNYKQLLYNWHNSIVYISKCFLVANNSCLYKKVYFYLCVCTHVCVHMCTWACTSLCAPYVCRHPKRSEDIRVLGTGVAGSHEQPDGLPGWTQSCFFWEHRMELFSSLLFWGLQVDFYIANSNLFYLILILLPGLSYSIKASQNAPCVFQGCVILRGLKELAPHTQWCCLY